MVYLLYRFVLIRLTKVCTIRLEEGLVKGLLDGCQDERVSVQCVGLGGSSRDIPTPAFEIRVSKR